MLSGCGAYYDPYYYDYVYYDPYYYGYDASYVYGWYDPYGVYYFTSSAQGQTAAIDLNAAAVQIAARAATYYTPAGCVSATPSGATVTYVFSDCTTQFASRPISGTVVVDLSQSGGQLIFTGSSSDLKVDGRPFILDLKAAATSAGTQRVVTITSSSRSPDNTDARQSQATMTWQQGSGCFEVNAQGSATSGSVTTNSTITNFQRCVGQCPTAGTVSVEGPKGLFTSTFNGEGTMTVTAPNGKQQTYDLQCQ
ncbi:MAG: hypothetical protein ACYC8T_16555 [Myxococcaceae bacterium]